MSSQSSKHMKGERDKEDKQVLHNSEYAVFSAALGRVLQVSHSELAKRIKTSKRSKIRTGKS